MILNTGLVLSNVMNLAYHMGVLSNLKGFGGILDFFRNLVGLSPAAAQGAAAVTQTAEGIIISAGGVTGAGATMAAEAGGLGLAGSAAAIALPVGITLAATYGLSRLAEWNYARMTPEEQAQVQEALTGIKYTQAQQGITPTEMGGMTMELTEEERRQLGYPPMQIGGIIPFTGLYMMHAGEPVGKVGSEENRPSPAEKQPLNLRQITLYNTFTGDIHKDTSPDEFVNKMWKSFEQRFANKL